MVRSAPYPTVTINFVTDEETRRALQARAQREDRSVSSVIRAAVRSLLAGRPPPHDEREPAAPA
jgi:hypothetical protein